MLQKSINSKTSLFYCLSAVKSDEFTGVNAAGVRVALLAARPDLIVVLNPQNPQSKSFEVMLGRKGSTVFQGYTSMGSVFLSLGLICCLIIPFPTEVCLVGNKERPTSQAEVP